MLRKAALLASLCAGLALAAAPARAADMPAHKGTMHARHHKMSCYDYAWQSEKMKDCLARPAAMHRPRKAMPHRRHPPMKKPMSQ
jgi:hypothetical protein